MVKNRQKSQLLVGVPNNRPISAKKRKKYAKIFVKKSVDMGLISEKICMGGWVFPFPVRTPPSLFWSSAPTPLPPGKYFGQNFSFYSPPISKIPYFLPGFSPTLKQP